jgi:uncharacterized protein
VALATWLRAQARIAIGFSGGVDSAYLAVAARQALGPDRVLAIIAGAHPIPRRSGRRRETSHGRTTSPSSSWTPRSSTTRGTRQPEQPVLLLQDGAWSKLVAGGRAHGFETVADGTNADDLADWRPWAQAAREHGIASPLADLGFTKQHIRVASRRLGIPTWQQPVVALSLLPAAIRGGGDARTASRKSSVPRAAARALGIAGDLRVRYHEDLARVELGAEELPFWMEPSRFETLREALLATGFARVALDLKGFRSGSLNVSPRRRLVTESDRGDRTARNATALASAIAELGVQCALEARGGLALLLPVAEERGGAPVARDETRRARAGARARVHARRDRAARRIGGAR